MSDLPEIDAPYPPRVFGSPYPDEYVVSTRRLPFKVMARSIHTHRFGWMFEGANWNRVIPAEATTAAFEIHLYWRRIEEYGMEYVIIDSGTGKVKGRHPVYAKTRLLDWLRLMLLWLRSKRVPTRHEEPETTAMHDPRWQTAQGTNPPKLDIPGVNSPGDAAE